MTYIHVQFFSYFGKSIRDYHLCRSKTVIVHTGWKWGGEFSITSPFFTSQCTYTFLHHQIWALFTYHAFILYSNHASHVQPIYNPVRRKTCLSKIYTCRQFPSYRKMLKVTSIQWQWWDWVVWWDMSRKSRLCSSSESRIAIISEVSLRRIFWNWIKRTHRWAWRGRKTDFTINWRRRRRTVLYRVKNTSELHKLSH